MRNSRRHRNFSVVIAVVAVSTLVVTIATHKKGTGPGAWFGVVLVSFFTGVFSLVATITFHLHVRWQQQLLRGEKLLAKWTVTPSEWQQFRVNDKPRLDTGRRNDVKVRQESEALGVEVLVAQDSLMIDDDFYKLLQIERLQYLPEMPPCLEYNMITSGKSGSVHWNIRFPVAAGAEAGARAIWDYVNRTTPVVDEVARQRRFRIARVAGTVIALISLPLLVFGLNNRGHTEIQTLVLTCLIVGFVGTPFGLFLSAMSHWMLRSAAKRASER